MAYNPTQKNKEYTFYIDTAYEFSNWLLKETRIELRDSPQLCLNLDNGDTECAVTAGLQRICQVAISCLVAISNVIFHL